MQSYEITIQPKFPSGQRDPRSRVVVEVSATSVDGALWQAAAVLTPLAPHESVIESGGAR